MPPRKKKQIPFLTNSISPGSDKSKSICKINNCGKEFKGAVVGNLKRRNLLCHPNELENVQISNLPEYNPKPRQTKNNLKIKMDVSTLNRACIKLVTVDSMPFRILDFVEGFREIIDPIYNALGVVINAHNVTKKIDEIATKIRHQISAELKNPIVCIKADGATRNGRSVLGINAQFIENNVIEIRTLR